MAKQDFTETYELVVGLEVHAQLLTNTKLFCGDPAEFGAEPNTQVSPITLAHPGTLPRLNKKAVEYAIMMGLACDCRINRQNYFARKNYFYPDLPKGYQISQHTTPVCVGGLVSITTASGVRNIQLNRIHLEEDAGKSIHDVLPGHSAIDYNRAGVPLIEIVTEPDIHTAEEAYAYLTELRKRLRYLGICDGNMEKGSMRCDANISLRLKGTSTLGTKVEVKNLNSIRNVKKAIEYEAARLAAILDAGETIVQQTRSFDAATGTTFALRNKEEANDYRYFPDPDLSPFIVSEAELQRLKALLPELPVQRKQRFINQYQLPEYDAAVLCDERETADLYEKICAQSPNYKAAANWMLGPVKAWLNEHNGTVADFPVTPEKLSRLIDFTVSGKLSFSVASSKILPALISSPGKDPVDLARELNLVQDSGDDELEDWVRIVLEKYPEKVAEYRKGKKGLLGMFMGEVKKLSRGKADPRRTTTILEKKLQS